MPLSIPPIKMVQSGIVYDCFIRIIRYENGLVIAQNSPKTSPTPWIFHPATSSYADTPPETMFKAKQQIKHQWFLRKHGVHIDQQSWGIHPRMIRIFPSEWFWMIRQEDNLFLHGGMLPVLEQATSPMPEDLARSDGQGLYTLWGCHMVLLMQSYARLPTSCNHVGHISKQQQQSFHTSRKVAKVKQAGVETIGTDVVDVMVMVHLSCFSAPNTLPPWTWGRASASLPENTLARQSEWSVGQSLWKCHWLGHIGCGSCDQRPKSWFTHS